MRKLVITPADSQSAVRASRYTFLGYGRTRSGKTRFLATMPRPLVLADATEGGWTTIQSMDPNLWWEPGRAPLVWAIEKPADIAEAVNDATPLIQRGDVQTLGLDSLSFYADLYLAGQFRSAGPNADNRKIYGNLGIHLRELRVQLHSLSPTLNVFWTALYKEAEEDGSAAGPMIPGQQGMKFAAGCDYILLFGTERTKDGMKYVIRTRQYGSAYAGGRDSGRLPDPLPGSTYREFLACFDESAPSAVADVMARPPEPASLSEPNVVAAPAVAPTAQKAKPVLKRSA